MDSRKNILVVDDRESWLRTINHILGRDYHVCLFAKAAEARKAFADQSFDLVILDKNLAGESGLDLLSDLRRTKVDLRAIILTEYEDVESAVLSMKLGALDYVTKTTPNLPQVLKQKVREALDADFATKPGPMSIANLISKGESAVLEFKSSLRWDLRANKLNKEIEKSVIRTIAAFMNSTDTGDLLIGVSDDGKAIGLIDDYKIMGQKKDRDAFENFLMSRIFQEFGKDCAPFIKIGFHSLDGNDVCQVRVSPAPKPMFVNDERGEQLYVRTGNSTRNLTTREAVEYCRIRWK